MSNDAMNTASGNPARNSPAQDSPVPGSSGDSYSAGPGQHAVLERQLNVLRDKARNLDRQLASATQNNSKLVAMLETAKAEILKLRTALENAGEPPYGFGTIIAINRPAASSGKATAVTHESLDIYASGRKMRVGLSPLLRLNELNVGQEVLLNEAFVVIAGLGYERVGELVTVKELLGSSRALVTGRADEERVVRLGGALKGGAVKVGDGLTLDARTGYALEKIPRSEVENLILEEVPDISYLDIGGLSSQIEQIRDAVELPVPGARVEGTQGHLALWASRMRQDADCQGGGQLAGQTRPRTFRRQGPEELLSQHQGP